VYEVTRNADTERPLLENIGTRMKKGTYYCAACGNKLFRSEPNSLVAVAGRVFFEQENKIVLFTKDNSFGMQRIEGCGRCDGHLGHL
jgi:peptide methionine sulfoxide reductase MsrB